MKDFFENKIDTNMHLRAFIKHTIKREKVIENTAMQTGTDFFYLH